VTVAKQVGSHLCFWSTVCFGTARGEVVLKDWKL